MTFIECIRKAVEEGYRGTDNTCKGQCSNCGECCGVVLPIDQEDADKIQEYVIKNNIFPQRQKLVMEQKWQCPYYNGSMEGCSIYAARPKVCRIYQCNKEADIKDIQELKDAIPVDMWSFAEAIEKEMLKNGINKKTGKTTKKII